MMWLLWPQWAGIAFVNQLEGLQLTRKELVATVLQTRPAHGCCIQVGKGWRQQESSKLKIHGVPTTVHVQRTSDYAWQDVEDSRKARRLNKAKESNMRRAARLMLREFYLMTFPCRENGFSLAEYPVTHGYKRYTISESKGLQQGQPKMWPGWPKVTQTKHILKLLSTEKYVLKASYIIF